MDTNETKRDAVEMLRKYLEYGQSEEKDEQEIYFDQCKYFINFWKTVVAYAFPA